MKKRNYIRAISFLSILCLLLAVTSFIYMRRSEKLSIYLQAERERSLAELSETLSEIQVNLQKSIYCSTGEKLLESGNELKRIAALAKDNLSELTDESEDTEAIFKFLSQVGDYTVSISGNTNIKDQDRENMLSLLKFSTALSNEFSALASGYYDGEISFEKAIGNLESEEEKIDFLTSFSDAHEALGDYPTLLYDGPFADNVLNRQATGLKSEKEITKKEGKEIAAKILNAKITEIKEEIDRNSTVPLYCFSKGEKTVGITKQGGYLCYMTNPSFRTEATIKEKEAAKRGADYIKKVGFENMSGNYYSTYDDVCTVNFAYKENGITYYSDLIKVGIAMDTGEVVSFDAGGYLTNHQKRTLPSELLSEEECRKILGNHLQIIDVSKALIPLDTGKELLCYEYHCKDKNGNEVLVYIDCQTGKEEEIMLLLYADDGVLTK